MMLDDDFNERIEVSSDEEGQQNKGKLTEEMVERLNFGSGQRDLEKTKTRKEIFEEIIEKSKAFKEAKQDLKQINTQLKEELDEGFGELYGLLDLKRSRIPAESKDERIREAEEKGKSFDDATVMLKHEARQKAMPVEKQLTEHERALQKRKKIEEELNT